MYKVVIIKKYIQEEIETFEKLVNYLDDENITHFREKTQEEYKIIKATTQGDIEKELIITLPTSGKMEEILQELKEENTNYTYEEENSVELNTQSLENLTEEEAQVFKTITKQENKKFNVRTNQQKIREQLEKRKREQEEAEQEEIIEQTFETPVKEEKLVQVEENQNFEKTVPVMTTRQEFQTPVTNEYTEGVATVYQATTIIPVHDLKAQFKMQVNGELEKLEKQIYILERQAREYKKLLSVINEANY